MQDIWDYKIKAHFLIDEIAAFGVSRNEVYATIARGMRVRIEEAHIKRMTTISQMHRVMHILRMVRDHQRKIAKRPPDPAKEAKRAAHKVRMIAEKAAAEERAIKREQAISERLAKEGIPRMSLKGKKNMADNIGDLQKMIGELNRTCEVI